jgi:hypothetical protein
MGCGAWKSVTAGTARGGKDWPVFCSLACACELEDQHKVLVDGSEELADLGRVLRHHSQFRSGCRRSGAQPAGGKRQSGKHQAAGQHGAILDQGFWQS